MNRSVFIFSAMLMTTLPGAVWAQDSTGDAPAAATAADNTASAPATTTSAPAAATPAAAATTVYATPQTYVTIAHALPAQRPQVNNAIAFPGPEHARPRGGVATDPRNVARVINGMSKHEVYQLLGVPHFGEGLFGVRRWNYLLKFYTGNGDEAINCQYQIQYDRNVRVAGTWFRHQECADWLALFVATPTAAPSR